jgi:hypothetical protein
MARKGSAANDEDPTGPRGPASIPEPQPHLSETLNPDQITKSSRKAG